jgi:hypothetical protein
VASLNYNAWQQPLKKKYKNKQSSSPSFFEKPGLSTYIFCIHVALIDNQALQGLVFTQLFKILVIVCSNVMKGILF